jgi:Molecular chaperone (small heat shock protein)
MEKGLTKRADSLFPDPFDILDRKGLGLFSRRGGWAYAFPRVDILETDKEVRVVADIPGVDPDAVDIEVRDNWMKISGQVDRESETGDGEQPYRYERYTGEFRREFALPVSVKEEEVSAEYKEGVLTVTLPKAEEQKRKKIIIKRR